MSSFGEALSSVGLKARPVEQQAIVSVDCRKTPAEQWKEAVANVVPLKTRK